MKAGARAAQVASFTMANILQNRARGCVVDNNKKKRVKKEEKYLLLNCHRTDLAQAAVTPPDSGAGASTLGGIRDGGEGLVIGSLKELARCRRGILVESNIYRIQEQAVEDQVLQEQSIVNKMETCNVTSNST